MTGSPTGAGSSTRRRCHVLVAVLTVASAALLVSACTSSAGPHPSRSATSSAGSYGSLPSFLPTPSFTPDAPLTGAANRPAVTSEGDTVQALVDGGSVRIRVEGPLVPGEGLPKVTPATTCTWTVTLTRATVRVPITPAAFTTLDEEGHAYHPVSPVARAKPPRSISPGQSVSFQLRAVMPTGEGVMRWAPTGGKVVAVWDFVVEND